MPYLPTNRSTTPIRLFKSDWLEVFTHIHPAIVLIVWLPVVAYFVSRPIVDQTLDLASILLAIVIGAISWSFTEYVIHRFLFHIEPRNPDPLVERAIFLFHGVHHVQPQCKTRLVMPPIVSVPLALVFYGLYTLIVGVILHAPDWVAPIYAASILGYVTYDMIHYATHHLPMRGRILKALKRQHMLHHYKTPWARFGVTSLVWDVIFGTLPDKAHEAGVAAG
jgi:sterol desaturase/sphingolipid hydroxylase (fatty acid hydroxylase superfamily)